MNRKWLVMGGAGLFGALVFGALLLVGSSGVAQDDEKPKKETKPVTKEGAKDGDEEAEKPFTPEDREKVSYGFGLNQGKRLGEFFKQSGADVDTDVLVKGLLDGLKGEKAKYTDEAIEAAFKAFQGELKKKRLAAAESNLKVGQAFLAANGKKEGVKATKTGIQYEVMKTGKGKSPKKTDTVTVHYHGTLIDGTVFDSSVNRKQTAQFPLDMVIKGWTEILQLMKVGDKWKVTIPSELAYGANPRDGGPIAPNSVLIFEIELISIDEADEAK